MPRFVIFTIFLFIIFLIIWAWVFIKLEPGPVLHNLAFVILAFINSTLAITLFLFFLRTTFKNRLKNWLGKHVMPIEAGSQRMIFRSSFKMAWIISLFFSVLVFLKVIELFSVFNLAVLIAIVIISAIYIYLRSRGII